MKTPAEVYIEVEDRAVPDPAFAEDRRRTVKRLAAQLRGEPPLDEAVETIIGDLCRAEDGKFSSCGGGATARSAAPDASFTAHLAPVRKPSTWEPTKHYTETRGGFPEKLSVEMLRAAVEAGVLATPRPDPPPPPLPPASEWPQIMERFRQEMPPEVVGTLDRLGYKFSALETVQVGNGVSNDFGYRGQANMAVFLTPAGTRVVLPYLDDDGWMSDVMYGTHERLEGGNNRARVQAVLESIPQGEIIAGGKLKEVLLRGQDTFDGSTGSAYWTGTFPARVTFPQMGVLAANKDGGTIIHELGHLFTMPHFIAESGKDGGGEAKAYFDLLQQAREAGFPYYGPKRSPPESDKIVASNTHYYKAPVKEKSAHDFMPERHEAQGSFTHYGATNYKEDVAEMFRLGFAKRDAKGNSELTRVLKRTIGKTGAYDKIPRHVRARIDMVSRLTGHQLVDWKMFAGKLEEQTRLHEALEIIVGDLCRGEDGRYVHCGTGAEVGPRFGQMERNRLRDATENQFEIDHPRPDPGPNFDNPEFLRWRDAKSRVVYTPQDTAIGLHVAHMLGAEPDRLARGMLERGFEFVGRSDLGMHFATGGPRDGLTFRHAETGVVVHVPMPMPDIKASVRVLPGIESTAVDQPYVVGPLFNVQDPDAALPLHYDWSRVLPPPGETVSGKIPSSYEVDYMLRDVEHIAEWHALSRGALEQVVYRFAAAEGDKYWETEHRIPGFTAAASAGDHTVTFYRGFTGRNTDGSTGIMEHEIGHLLTLGTIPEFDPASKRGVVEPFSYDGFEALIPGFGASPRDVYRNMFERAAEEKFGVRAASKDRERFGSFVSEYGSTNANEDMAEMFRVGTLQGASADHTKLDDLLRGLTTAKLQTTKQLTPVPAHAWVRAMVLNDVAPRPLVHLDRLDAQGLLAPLTFHGDQHTYQELRDRLAEFRAGKRTQEGRLREAMELCAAQLAGVTELCGAQLLLEAFDLIVGNLCRDERGRFVPCSGEETQAALPGMAGATSLERFRSGHVEQAFADPQRVTLNVREGDATHLERTGFTWVDAAGKEVAASDDARVRASFMLGDMHGQQENTKVEFTPAVAARALGLPSGAQIDFGLPNRLPLTVGSEHYAELARELENGSAVLLRGQGHLSATLSDATPIPLGAGVNPTVESQAVLSADVEGTLRLAVAYDLIGRVNFGGDVFNTTFPTFSNMTPEEREAAETEIRAGILAGAEAMGVARENVTFNDARALLVNDKFSSTWIDVPEEEDDDEGDESADPYRDTPLRRADGIAPDEDKEIVTQARAVDSEEALAKFSADGPYAGRYLYHVTTAADLVADEGLLSRNEMDTLGVIGVGLGNPDKDDPLVSLTDDPLVARNIEQALSTTAQLTEAKSYAEAAEKLRYAWEARYVLGAEFKARDNGEDPKAAAEQAQDRAGDAFDGFLHDLHVATEKAGSDPEFEKVFSSAHRVLEDLLYVPADRGVRDDQPVDATQRDAAYNAVHVSPAHWGVAMWKTFLGASHAHRTGAPNPVLLGTPEDWVSMQPDPRRIRTFKVATNARTRTGDDSQNRELIVRPGRTLLHRSPIDWRKETSRMHSGIFDQVERGLNEAIKPAPRTMMQKIMEMDRAYRRRRGPAQALLRLV